MQKRTGSKDTEKGQEVKIQKRAVSKDTGKKTILKYTKSDRK